MIYEFLAPGFEECEALGVLDCVRRAGLPITTVSIKQPESDLLVEGSHGVNIQADKLFSDCDDFSDADMLFLPGGLPGATNLYDFSPLRELLLRHHAEGKAIAAICAAPMVIGRLGILKGRKATCYPGFETELQGATPTGALVEVDGEILTGKGPAAAYYLGYAVIEYFLGKEKADEIARGMLVKS